jgi:cupin superfamily acireductone dioxygenase involved in methionine salvage
MKANIINNGLVFVPFDENLPYIEVSEEQYTKIENGELTFKNGVLIESIKANPKIYYKKEVERLIALRYDIRDELAIQRQKDEKPEEYKEYYDYVEQCKREVKNALQ